MTHPCTTPGCGHHRDDDTFVCRHCRTQLGEDLASTPALWTDLGVTLTRQDVLGSDGGAKSAETALPFKEGAIEARYILGNVLGIWAREIAATVGHTTRITLPAVTGTVILTFPPPSPARWLLTNLNTVVAHPDAGTVVDEIHAAVSAAYRAIDRPPELLLAGRCPAAGCGGVLYARPGDTFVACPACTAGYEVRARRDHMMQSAAVLRVTQTVAMSWVRLLMDCEVPYRTWQSWRQRGRLVEVAVNHEGHPLYVFGSVQDLVIAWRHNRKRAA